MFVSDQISQLKIENNFNPTTNSYSASSTFYQQQPASKTLTNSFNSFSGNSPLKSHHSHHLSPAAQPAVSQPTNNVVRESLDDRLNHLFLKKGFGNSFFGELSGLGPSLSSLSNSFESTGKQHQRNSDYYHRANKDTTSHASFHSEQILGTPPSPFLSYSEFIKSTKVTKAVDEGRNPSLSDEDNNDYNRSNSNSCDDDDNVFNNQDTPKRKLFTRNRYRQSSRSNYNKKTTNSGSTNNKHETMNELDDDRMSLSSLSSGEKLELPNDSERVSFERKGFVPFTINSNDSVLKRNKYAWNNSGDSVKLNNHHQNYNKYHHTISSAANSSSSSAYFDKGSRRPNQLSSKHRFNDVFDHPDDDYGRREAAEENQGKLKRSRLQKIKQGVIKIVVAELKSIIQKDINKKMIESTAFQIYENWWDESEKQFKLKKEQKENQENLNSTEKSSAAKPVSGHKEELATISSVLSTVSYNKAGNTNPFNSSEGYQFGHLRAAMPKMPSFRRKVKQTRNEESRQNDHRKGGLSDDEFENISSDDEAFNDRKYVKNRSAAIIDNSLMDSVSDDSDDSSSSLSLSKHRKRKHLTKNRGVRSSSSSNSSSSGLSSSGDSSSNESSGSDEESGSDEDTRSHRSSISASSLESFDRDRYSRTGVAGKKIKSSAASLSSKKSPLLSSISQSSISSKSLESYDEISRSSLSAIESEEDEISSRLSVEKVKADERLDEEQAEDEQPKVQIEKQPAETEELEAAKQIDSPQPVPEDKPVKRKVGRPPKANKQAKNKQDKTLDGKLTSSAATANEKENVKPLKQDLVDELIDVGNENDLMTREELEASEALMALSGLFGAPTSTKQQTAASNLVQQPKPVIHLSDEQKARRSYEEAYSGVDTDSASESEMMDSLLETLEESVAIDHAYCIRAKRRMPKSKYDNGNYDFSTILDDDQMRERVNEHLASSQLTSDPFGKAKGKKRQQAAAARKAKKLKAAKENDENVDLNLIVEKPKIRYDPRSKEAELEILYDLIRNGIDSEDVRYLKRGYDALLQEDESHAWLNETHWSEHPPTKISAPTKKKKKAEELRVHLTGCARAEGYYKMTDKEKAKSSYVVNATQEAEEGNENEDSSKALRARVPTTQQATREARSNQRRLLATVDVAWSDLLKFNQLQFRKKQLKFARSKIHDWGLFALEPIAADEMVIEYVGQMIRPVVADLREKKYNEMGIGSSYLFRVDLETIIDATKVGNLARFINHSCTVSEKLENSRNSKNFNFFNEFQALLGQ